MLHLSQLSIKSVRSLLLIRFLKLLTLGFSLSLWSNTLASEYRDLLKTGSLDNTIREFSLAL